MAKKIVVGLLLLIFSVLTTALASFSSLMTEITKYVEELVEEEKYIEAYQTIYGGTIMQDTPVYEYVDNDMTIHIYKVIAVFYDEDYKIESVTEGVEVVFYNSEKKFKDVTDVSIDGFSGKVEVSKLSEYYYDEYNVFSVLIDTTNHAADINKINFSNETETIYTLNIEDSSAFSFTSDQKDIWHEFIEKFNLYHTSELTENEANDLYSWLEEHQTENLQADKSFLVAHLDSNVITSRTGYVVKTVVTFIFVIIADVIVVYLVFIKKRGQQLVPISKGKDQNSNKKEVINIEETNEKK